MSKIKREVTRAPYTEIVTVACKCDLCGTVSGQWRGWGKDSYDRQDVEIEYTYGHSYPEGGSGEKETFDVCPACWREKLVPWFKSHGAEPTITDWDF
jgi:hypothetical protein